MAKTITHSTTKAKVLTGITVAAAGVAAYAVANLSSEPSAINLSSGPVTSEMRQSCISTCEEHGGKPCSLTIDAGEAALCRQEVQSCIDRCPVVSTSVVALRGDASTEALPAARVGSEYRARLVIAGYEREQGIWEVSESATPAGLTIDPQGTLFGTPTRTGDYRFTLNFTVPEVAGVRPQMKWKVRATLHIDAAAAAVPIATSPNLAENIPGLSSAATAAIPVRITTPLAMVSLTKDQPYELRLAAEGLTADANPIWFVSYGQPPEGLTLTDAGRIHGTPIKSGTSAVGIAVRTNVSGPNAAAYVDAHFTVAEAGQPVPPAQTAPDAKPVQTVAAAVSMSPASAALPEGRVGTYASFPFSITGDSSDRVWMVEGIGASDGMKFDADTHVLYGTPLVPKSFSIVVRASKGSDVLTKAYTWNVVANALPLSVGTSLPDGEANKPYRAVLQATGGSGEYSWGFERPTAVPAGWSLSASGELKAETPKEGVYTFTVRLVDTVSNMAKSFDVVVNIKQVVATAGTDATKAVTDPNKATGTTQTTTDPNKATTGTAVPQTKPAGSASLITIDTSLPTGEAGKDYVAQLKAVGGSGGYRWAFGPNDPPPVGWSLSSSGELRIQSPRQGTRDFSVHVADLAGTSFQDAVMTVQIGAAAADGTKTTTTAAGSEPLAFKDVGTYPDGFVSIYYNSRPFQVAGGKAPYRFSVGSGLPDGLTMDENGYITGTPSKIGTFSFVMTIRDASNDTVQSARVIRIRDASERVVTNTVEVPMKSSDPIAQARLDTMNRMGLRIHDLVKLQDDGDPNTQFDTTVYYLGTDGRRHAFPNPQVYFSWFPNFSMVRTVGPRDLSDLPLGANITYRPGTRLVKFISDPRVYVVDRNRQLRVVRSEADARAIYGTNWAMSVDDISDAFYMDYRLEGTIDNPSSVSPAILTASTIWPSEILP